MSTLTTFLTHQRSSSPYINRFLSADSIVPDYANPQSLNRYAYVLNNPLRYTDPSGHNPCRSDYLCKRRAEKLRAAEAATQQTHTTGTIIQQAAETPQGCTGLACFAGGINPFGGILGSTRTNVPTVTTTPLPTSVTSTGKPPSSFPQPWYSGITNFAIGILSNPYTSVTTSAIQVLTGGAMEVGLSLMAIPGAEPLGAAVAIGAYTANRAAAIIGTSATYYQYSNGMNGVNGLDVTLSITTTIVGTFPQYSEAAALISFFYDFANAPPLDQLGD